MVEKITLFKFQTTMPIYIYIYNISVLSYDVLSIYKFIVSKRIFYFILKKHINIVTYEPNSIRLNQNL